MTGVVAPKRRWGVRWIVGHVLVFAIVVACVNLGFWQLRRLSERRAHNATVIARSKVISPLPLPGWGGRYTGDLDFLRVEVTGIFEPEREFLVRFRSRRGLPGYEVVTPLRTGGGTVLVDRGWVPLGAGDAWPVASAEPPRGSVTVTGLLAPPEGGGLRAVRHGSGPLVIGSIDVAKLRSRFPGEDLYAAHLIADGPSAGYPIPVDPPDLGEGPHLSYAVQWFSFASVGAIGWILLVSRRGRPSRRPAETDPVEIDPVEIDPAEVDAAASELSPSG